MQSHQLARQIQAEPVSRHVFAGIRTMKALENIRLGLSRNAATGIRHSQLHLFSGTPRDDANGSSRRLYFRALSRRFCTTSCCIFYLADNFEGARNVGFDPQIRRLRQRLEIVDPFFDEMGKVDRLEP